VLGVSFDTRAENREFAELNDYSFPLLCDTTRTVGLAYRACDSKRDKYAKRLTYVIGPDGTIEQAIDTQDPGAQASELLLRL
jgi:peroxiredoxin Q/BCP